MVRACWDLGLVAAVFLVKLFCVCVLRGWVASFVFSLAVVVAYEAVARVAAFAYEVATQWVF